MTRPNNEAHLISSMINTHAADATVAYGITPDMFVTYGTEYRWAINHSKIYDTPPTPEALTSRFGDFPFTTATDVAFFSDELRQEYTKREFVKMLKEAAHKASEGDMEEALIAWASFSPPTAGSRLISDYADDKFLDGYGEEQHAMTVPWKTLQNVTGGMRPGDYWTFAARLSQGKSWFLLDFAAHSMMDGRDVMMYSLEMSERQCNIRLHVKLGKLLGIKVDHVDMRDGMFPRRDYENLLAEIRERVPGHFYVHDAGKQKVTPALIQANAKKVDISLVDYIGLMSTTSGDAAIKDWRFAAEVSNNLKEIAVSQDARILTAAQINREGDSTGWKPPRLSQLSQTDAIGQDSDVAITMKQFSRTTAICGIEKNRHGPAGIYFWTNFKPNVGDMDEITRSQAEAIMARETDQ
jgi:replicative DNA helicase